jgi:hypothetical protein
MPRPTPKAPIVIGPGPLFPLSWREGLALACIVAACLLLGLVAHRPSRQCALWSETPSPALAGEP